MTGYDAEENVYYCRECGLEYPLRRDAEKCEDLHDEGW